MPGSMGPVPVTRKKSGKEYHKVKEFVKVFPKLDTSKLKIKFNEFEELIEKIK